MATYSTADVIKIKMIPGQLLYIRQCCRLFESKTYMYPLLRFKAFFQDSCTNCCVTSYWGTSQDLYALTPSM